MMSAAQVGASEAPGHDAEVAPAGADTPGFDPDRPHRLSPSVSVRPESFGALVYHFGTRRLSFLKTKPLVAVVTGLADHDDVHGAMDTAEIPAEQRATYLNALAGLARAGTIERRGLA